jgi:lysophospholipase L1-like esterase
MQRGYGWWYNQGNKFCTDPHPPTELTMNSLPCTAIAALACALTSTLFAAEPSGLDSLTGKNSPLQKGETIAFFGDSITQAGARDGGYCKLISKAIKEQNGDLGVKIIYAGISGHKVPNLQGRLEKDVLSKKPTVVFIYIGINDVWHSTRGRGTPKDKFDAGLRDLIEKITASGAEVVLCTPSTIGEKTDGSNKLDGMLEEYSAVSRKVAEDSGVTLCDLRVAFIEHLKKANPDNKERGILTGDGVHLNAAGNEFVANQAAAAIATALRERNEASDSENESEPAQCAEESETVSLFNGKDLEGWHADIPAADGNKEVKPSFVARDGMLVSLGRPNGHLITDKEYENFRLEAEYRFPGKPGNCGILVFASTPRSLYKMFPKSIEVQMNSGHAGDFWCIVEDITVPNMEERRGPKKNWGITEGKGRRILNLTDGSERPLGEWNSMRIECLGNEVKVWVNGDLVNHGTECTASKGQIAVQAEGAEVEFRKLELTPISELSE